MKTGNPRHGSMQYWPRKRAKSIVARVRSWFPTSEAQPLGFAAYKAGMTHVIYEENRSSLKKLQGQDTFCPVTILECPPLKVAGVRVYKKTPYGITLSSEVLTKNLDKELSRTIQTPKTIKTSLDSITDFEDIRLLVYTQPKLTGVGKKKPEIFELAIGGSKEDQLAYAKDKLGKEITVEEVFKEGEQVDVHAVTKGKGNQGPVKRFGIGLRARKSEKTIRGPGSLGPWKAHGHIMYRVAFSGQTGYHLRTEHNKQILQFGDKPEEIKIKGGIPHYGFVKGNYILVRGSVAGPKKRLIKLTKARHPKKILPGQAPKINYVSLESKQ